VPKTRKKKRRNSHCPKGWVPAGAVVPVRLTKKQEAYCNRAVGIARFCYNLAVATHRFCLATRLCQPGWMDLYSDSTGRIAGAVGGKREDTGED